MCTAVTLNRKTRLFGRNFDFHRSFGEKVTLTPRNFPLSFRHLPTESAHAAILGMAAPSASFPLYFDAVNEHGLAAAGLNFPKLTTYSDTLCENKHNLTSFELIPWVLSKCSSVCEARESLENVNITSEAITYDMPATPLHYIVTDGKGSIILECLADGVRIYENDTGVLTNCPSFDIQVKNYNSAREKIFPPRAEGLPGDFSSESRFIRAAYVREQMMYSCVACDTQSLFHLLASASVPEGCVKGEDGEWHYTRYASCMSCEGLQYHFRRYEDVFARSIIPESYELELTMLITYG